MSFRGAGWCLFFAFDQIQGSYLRFYAKMLAVFMFIFSIQAWEWYRSSYLTILKRANIILTSSSLKLFKSQHLVLNMLLEHFRASGWRKSVAECSTLAPEWSGQSVAALKEYNKQAETAAWKTAAVWIDLKTFQLHVKFSWALLNQRWYSEIYGSRVKS